MSFDPCYRSLKIRLSQYGNLFYIDLASKLINFGVNDVLVFQGAK
jgi:hypothetical protein